jgi:enediyne biosynthesis protein E4
MGFSPRDLARRSVLGTFWISCTVTLAVAAGMLASGEMERGGSSQTGGARARTSEPTSPYFIELDAPSGVDFLHYNGATGELLLPEVTGAGGALFDFDNDGDLDLYVVQGAALKPGAHAGAAPWTGSGPPRDRLYRNDLRIDPDGSRTVRFVDVTEQSGIDARGYGMGVATGDFDNDGWIDLYVTNLGSNQLLRNNGDGTFTDVTVRSGTDDPRWSTGATFFDFDGDGWLDLFVTNYVDFDVGMKRECFSRGTARDYCNPAVYDPVPDRLFRNNGDGTFTDVSVQAGITRGLGRGLGVIAVDVNGDGWADVYVANDGDPNQLWINKSGSGVFTDEALLAGVALNRMGLAEGGMGIDAADPDGDGDEDLFVTNLDNESNTLYVNRGDGLFEDRTIDAGLLLPSLGLTGFGTRFLDFDNDGWLDLIVVNGAVRHLEPQIRAGDPYPLKQRNQLLRNVGGGRFVDVSSAAAGPSFERLEVSRGLASGDLDNDGAPDMVIFNNNGPVRVLLNRSASGRHWIGTRVFDSRARRDGFQARVEIVRPGARSLWRRVHTDGSYLAAGDPRVLFGLENDRSAQTIRVHWPGGRVDEFRDLAVDRYWVLEPGRARPQ